MKHVQFGLNNAKTKVLDKKVRLQGDLHGGMGQNTSNSV